jgi:hypothetical protein
VDETLYNTRRLLNAQAGLEFAMTEEHFERTLRTFWRRKPFRSFSVALVNGDRLRVDHPEALVLRSGVAVFVAADGTPSVFDHESVSEFAMEAKSKKPA